MSLVLTRPGGDQLYSNLGDRLFAMSAQSTTRNAHPFFMYEHLQAQPAAFAEVALRNRPLLTPLAEANCHRPQAVPGRHRYVVSRGADRRTSVPAVCSHHAMRGLAFVRLLVLRACAIGGRRGAGDQPPGAKQYTLRALEIAKEAGCTTAMIVGQNAPAPPLALDAVFETVAQEKSSAHTVSHVASVAVLAELTRQVGGSEGLDDELLEQKIPAALADSLATETQMVGWATEHQTCRRIWLVGAGPTAVTAHEAALKIKETSYLQAEGLSVETLLHGAFQCCEAEDLFVLMAPAGAAQPRLRELPAMIRDIGARCVVLTDDAAALEGSVTDCCVVPVAPAPFEALVCLPPLQLFAYHLALVRGTNPDCFRLNDPRFAAAMARVKL